MLEPLPWDPLSRAQMAAGLPGRPAALGCTRLPPAALAALAALAGCSVSWAGCLGNSSDPGPPSGGPPLRPRRAKTAGRMHARVYPVVRSVRTRARRILWVPYGHDRPCPLSSSSLEKEGPFCPPPSFRERSLDVRGVLPSASNRRHDRAVTGRTTEERTPEQQTQSLGSGGRVDSSEHPTYAQSPH